MTAVMQPTAWVDSEVGDMQSMARVFDDFVDKDRRKNSLVVHNLPESEESSQAKHSLKDIMLFQEVVKESLKINVAISRSLRVGRADSNGDRLLIVTLDTPGVNSANKFRRLGGKED